jgi:DNA-binding NtrC family response regulator
MPSASSGDAARPRARVLLLEHDPDLREILIELFAYEQVAVTLCASFAELRAAVAAHPGAVVVSDSWSTAGNRAVSAAQRAQLVALSRTAVVILTTGRAWGLTSPANEFGTVSVLAKPYDLDQLMRLIWSATAPGAGT